MATQTPQQWLAKIESWIPAWWVDEAVISPGILLAIATYFSSLEQDQQDQFNQTFVTRASHPLLDLLGDELGVTQLLGEADPSYVSRIQRITSQTDKADVVAAVNAALVNPGCKIQQAPGDLPYDNRGSFCSRDQYLSTFLQNFFILVIPKQVHAPYSFASRSGFDFSSRGNFAGTNATPAGVYSGVVQLVNSMIADGVMWALVESTKPVVV